MKKLFSISVSLLLFVTAYSHSITGTVRSSTHEAIPFANIVVLNSNIGTATNKDGNFELTLPAGSHTVVVSFVGYATQTKTVQIETGKSVTIDFTLTEQSNQLDEVVVSSEKREETLQKTPIAISALNAQQLKNYRIWDVRDLTAVVPNLFVIEHAGSTGANFVNVRGIMGFTPEQSVATYVDGVYQYDYFSAPSQYLNIERIEVLRGPQGTLYGRNSLAGVVNIITKQPTNTTSGQVELNFGNYGQQRYSAVINTPLIKNKLFATAAFMYSQRGATIKNQGKDYDTQNGKAFNFGLKYLANNKLTFDFNLKGNFAKDHGAYPWHNVKNIDSLLKSQGVYDIALNSANIEQRSNINTSLTARYSAKKINLISISAYNSFHYNFPGNYDADFTAADIASGNATYLHGQNNFSEEVRISSNENNSKLNWVGGVYAFSQKYNKVSTVNYDSGAIAAYGLTQAPFSYITYNPVLNTGISFFGQLGYRLSSKWNITLGGRFDNEKRKLSQYTDTVKNNLTTFVSPQIDYSHTYSKFTPKATLSYQITETEMLYASYAKGYRVGGFNPGLTPDKIVYNPENSDNFEVGYKSTFLNNRVRFNAALFSLYEKGHQVYTTTDGITDYFLNLGDYKSTGIETELTAVIIKGLQAQWNFSYTDGKFTKLQLFDNATSTTKDYSGNRIIFAPPVTSMLAIQYNYQLGKNSGGSSLFVRGEWRYVGKYYFDYYNQTSQDAYGLLNARAGLTIKKYDVAFWVRNLTDIRYVTYGNQSPSFPLYMVSNPRMWGITLTGRF